MANIAKRTVMNLYSDNLCPYSHQVRIVLAEKGVNVEIHDIQPQEVRDELLEHNPYGTAPTLVDRDLVLYEARIIMEYLDERFPYPPLLPVYPVARAECRKLMHRIDEDWYSLLKDIEDPESETAEQSRNKLLESLVSVAPILQEKRFFMNDEFSLVDCCMAPLLWRFLPMVRLPAQAALIRNYAARLFSRPSFQASLTDAERESRAA